MSNSNIYTFHKTDSSKITCRMHLFGGHEFLSVGYVCLMLIFQTETKSLTIGTMPKDFFDESCFSVFLSKVIVLL